jgi:glycosyltransferase involved in cell wall biosynthesis
MRKKWSLQRRMRKIEKIYRLPTVKIAVSRAVKEVIDRTYGGPCFLVPNGIDQNIFSPSPLAKNFQAPLRILSVGPFGRVSTGIDDTYTAIRLLRQKGLPIEFLRVSLYPFNEAEMKSGLVDRFIMGVNEKEMAELYRNSHILIAPSLWEGFGLPVVEAMNCGLPCILTDSGSYRSLDPVKDFAYFVENHSPEGIIEGVIRLRDDIDFRERIIKRGLEVSRQYSLENMDNALEKTLFDILKK